MYTYIYINYIFIDAFLVVKQEFVVTCFQLSEALCHVYRTSNGANILLHKQCPAICFMLLDNITLLFKFFIYTFFMIFFRVPFLGCL